MKHVGPHEEGPCEDVEEPYPHPHQQKSSNTVETSENKDQVPEQVTGDREEGLELHACQIFLSDPSAASCLPDIARLLLKPCRLEL
jgi:hypothetical protein